MNRIQIPHWTRINNSVSQASYSLINNVISSESSGITLSAQVNRDGTAYLYHDEYVNGEHGGYFRYFSNEDVKSIQGHGQPIMTLENALQTIITHSNFNESLVINIELRGMESINAVKNALTPLLKQQKIVGTQCILSSFDQVIIKSAGPVMPTLKRAVCVFGTPIDYASCLYSCDAQEMHITNNFIDQTLINDINARGAVVRVDVSSNPHLGRIDQLCVDGLIK
jgi:hypothetical protein